MNFWYCIASGFFGLVVGGWMGVVLGYGRRQLRSPDTTPRCLCGHVFGIHKKGLRCQAQDTVRRGGRVDQYTSCACTIYVGPDPLISGLWSPKEPA